MDIFWAEVIGTMLLILLGNGCVCNVLLGKSKGQQSGWIVISAGWGFAVAMAVYVTDWISGAHINPAVTFGFCLAKKTAWNLLPLYLSGQFLGAFLGACLVFLTYYPHWQKTPDPQLKLLCFATQPAIRSYKWNFICEVIATAVLVIGILSIFNVHNQVSHGMGPYLVGILIFSLTLSLGGPTGCALNPARDLAPRLAYAILPIRGKGSADWAYAWIPVIAPLVGSMIGVWIYTHFISPSVPLMT